MAKQQTSAMEKVRVFVPDPPKYNVIFHNDDVTTMDFVVMALTQIFFKDQETAVALMLKVHEEGSAVVGTYPYDIAKSKAMKTIRQARQEGFPLKVTWEAE